MPATFNTSANLLSAVRSGVAVVLSDSTVIPMTRALWVGATGAIKVRHSDGTTPTYAAVPVGFFAVEVDMVFTTGTAASSIIACY